MSTILEPRARLIDAIQRKITSITDGRIRLLKNREVLMWLFGDLSFLPLIENVTKTVFTKRMKVLEDEWGRNCTKLRRPDLSLEGQWTTKFGEHLCEELFMLNGIDIKEPVKKENYQPDLETEEFIIEVKTQTQFTTGTAGEKIMGVPFKYAHVPRLYGKPVKIVCIGGGETICRDQYGLLEGDKCLDEKRDFIEFQKTRGFEFVAATDLLKSFIGDIEGAQENQ